MRRKIILFVVATAILALSAGPAFGYCTFNCRYQSSGAEIYIDPFHAGKMLTKGDCVQYLVHGSFSLREDYLTPVSPRRMLLRVCGNLHQIYLQLEAADEITRLQRYLVALAR